MQPDVIIIGGGVIGTVTLEEATSNQREVSEEYVEMAEVLSR